MQNITLPDTEGKNINTVYFIAFIIALLTFIVYLPALQNGFVNWDDDVYVYKNLSIQSLDLGFLRWVSSAVVSANWHPLTLLSYATDYAIWGLNPFGYHLVNIVLHSANTFLVFLLSYKLISYGKIDSILIPSILAFLFGVHPLHVESVAWVSERKDVLCALFFLLAIICYIKYISDASKKLFLYFLSIIFFILSLTSKPMSVSLPLVLLIIDYYPFNRFNLYVAKKIIIEKVPFIFLSLISSIITIWAQDAGGALKTLEKLPLLDRIAVAGRAYTFYLEKMVLPFDLAPLYPYPTKNLFSSPEHIGSLILLIIVSIIAIRSSIKKRFVIAAWLYYIITLLPVIGVVQVGGQAAADRYTYLPSLGPFLAFAILVGMLYQNVSNKYRIPIAIIMLIFAGGLIHMTINQIKIWRDPITLWTHEIMIYPESASVAYNSRGIIYYDNKNNDLALKDFNKAIEINPQYLGAYNNRGLVYRSTGDNTKAIKDFNKAIKINPDNATGYYNRGVSFNSLGNYNEAIDDFNKAIKINPQYVNAYHTRGYAYYKLEMYSQALNDISTAIELDPEDAKIWQTRGIVYASSGSYQKALMDLQTAVDIDPEYAEAYYNMGLVYQRLNDPEKSLFYLNKADTLMHK